jgi:lipid-A-disaccharide synthase
MKYYVIAGEASGDLHGANVLREIARNDASAEFRLWGGERMSDAVQTPLVKHYKTYDYMGIVEVIKHLRTILKNKAFCKQDIAQYKPDAILFIDFPGFNLRIAPYAKSLGIKTFYFISPTVWAWKESRVKTIQASVDHMFVELPFVKTFYETRHNYHVDFVGHPLLDSIHAFSPKYTYEQFIQKFTLPQKPIIAVMPGSREYEIRENLLTMQAISHNFSEYEFVIAGMSRFSKEFYTKYITASNVSIVFDATYELLSKADAAIVVSGTATLETALFGVPQVIVYKTSPITFYIAKMVVNLNFLGLPNLIMNEQIVPELLQKDMNSKNLNASLHNVLFSSEVRKQIAEKYAALREKLGNVGAAKRTADLIQKYLHE